jgi:hypothetical protein
VNKNPNNKLFIIGLTCQAVGLFCFFSFWLMYCAIAFFSIGTTLIFLSKKTWYLKLISITPLLWVIGIIINALYFEKYIIPASFRGVVYVITDKENGEDRTYDLFTRIYKIPNSGVLFTKFKQRSGFNKRSFYQVDKNGFLQPLRVLDYRSYIEKWVINPPKTEPPRDSLAIFTPEIRYNSNSKEYSTVFTVGKYKDIKVWNYLPEQTIDSLRNAQIK